jgi:hypothetical protein
MTTKRALLIGINYTANPSAQLSGCINDIVNVRNTLIDAYGYQNANIFMLRDDDNSRLPTRKNILYSLNQLINASNANDLLWIHYSGHGTKIRDTNGDEIDSLDECIVPCNYNTDGIISDDELFSIIKNAKCRLIMCFDSCHSGTVCDLQYSINCNNGGFTTVVNNNRTISGQNIIMFSGCRDAQTSADSYSALAKQGVGAFTNTLLETLRENDHTIDILQLYLKVCQKLKNSGFTQIPVFSSSVASPSFQFARSNANGTPVLSVLNMSDLNKNLKYTTNTNVKKEMKRRMGSIFKY